ncbi:MAG: hypothetical protein HC902_05165 [Calothrix sp. SM1_5_4]|nr:hypothetical protein [Calothrix sp. SM1_5_4]
MSSRTLESGGAMAGSSLSSTVLEGVNYITFGGSLSPEDARLFDRRVPQWCALPIDLHVIDLKGIRTLPDGFCRSVSRFSGLLTGRNARLVTLHLDESLFHEITRLGYASSFNRVVSLAEDLVPRKDIGEQDLRRLLHKYLVRAAYSAVEITCNSTVSCDENYVTDPARLPLDEIDLISLIDVRSEFLTAQFRLYSSSAVLEQLAIGMLGKKSLVDNAVIESMATELLNLIYGGAKSTLNDAESFRLPPAIPRLLRKPDLHRIKRSSAANLTVLPLVTPMGSFFVEIDYGTGTKS